MEGTKRERLSPVAFYEEQVLPALFERLDVAFPDFGWRRKGQGWTATNREYTKTLAGARPDRVVCNVPVGYYVHGGESVSWASHVSGIPSPRGRDFVEAVRQLADLAGVDASPLDREPTPEEEAERRKGGLLEAFFSYARGVLHSDAGKAAREYLVSRGFEVDALEDLPFGRFSSAEEVRAHLEAAGFGAEDLKRSGLLADSRWSGRLVIPWRDRWGCLRSFVARDLSGEAEEGSKYLYSRGTNKAALVAFGLDVALRSKGGRADLVLVEGILDVISLQSRDFPNVAGIGGSGSELSPGRWEALEGFGVRSVTLALDADEAGREGLSKALINTQKAANVPEVYVVDPSAYRGEKDPDAFVRSQGLDAFRGILESRTPGPVYRARVLLGDVTPESPTHERREAVEGILDLDAALRGSAAPLDSEDILRETADRTGYSLEALTQIADGHAERHRKEGAEKALAGALAEAEAARKQGAAALDVARTLTGTLASLQAKQEQPPPAFSVERLERESKETPAGLRSGWEAVDSLGARFNPGELSLMAARTGHCKTSALAGLLLNWLQGEEAGTGAIVFYSAEEPEVRIYHRLLALLTAGASEAFGRWNSNEVRDFLRGADSERGYPNPEAMEDARARLRSWEDRLLIVHRPGWTVEAYEAHARDLAERLDVGAVLVDYLQRIPGPRGSFDRRDIEVSTVARRLKALSETLGAPVVVGAQINREAVASAPKVPPGPYSDPKVRDGIRRLRPKLHQLREGGSEQEADLVLGLLNYRADFETDEGGDRAEGRVPDVTRLDIGTLKNRFGEVGRWAALAFEGRYHWIRDAERGEV